MSILRKFGRPEMILKKGSYPHPFSGGPHIMGVVNVTPDSFSDGGYFFNHDKAIEHGLKLAREGASILDIGGESTRPGSYPVDVEEEIRRVVPVIEGLKGRVPWLSVDTRNAKTMEAALKAGANAINDISGLTHDSRSVFIVSESQAPVFVMHMQGEPRAMQNKPFYNNVLRDVYEWFSERIRFFDLNRIEMDRVVIDPGIGFGKTIEDNIVLLRNIKKFHELGVPLLLGVSRKSFIGKLSQDEPPHDRIPGSLAAALWGLSQGVQVFRVHDVKETVQAFKIFRAIESADGADL